MYIYIHIRTHIYKPVSFKHKLYDRSRNCPRKFLCLVIQGVKLDDQTVKMSFSCGEGVQSLFYKRKSFLIWDSLSGIWTRRLKHHSNTFAQSGSWTDWTSATRNVCCLLECRATACPVVLRTCEKYFLITPWRWPLSCEAFSSFTPVYREILHIVLLLTFMFLKTIVQYFKGLLCKFSVQDTVPSRKPLPRTVFAALDQTGRWNEQNVVLNSARR